MLALRTPSAMAGRPRAAASKPARNVAMRYAGMRSYDEEAARGAAVLPKEWPAASTSLASVDDVAAYFAEHPTHRPKETTDMSPDLSGEWPSAWSLATWNDLNAYYAAHGKQAQQLLPGDRAAAMRLEKVMSTDLTMVTPDMPLDAIRAKLQEKGVSGMPVVDDSNRLVGVVAKSDIEGKAGAVVADVMTSPPIAVKPTARVKDAAVLMLKHKVHRIPVVDSEAHVVGMVTRSDIFQAMEKN